MSPPAISGLARCSYSSTRVSSARHAGLLADHQPGVPAGYLETVVAVRIDALHECIRCLDVARAGNPLQFGKKSRGLRRVLQHMRSDDEIECLIAKRQLFDEPEHQRPAGDQRRPMTVTGFLKGIEQHVRARVRIAAGADFQHQRRRRHRAVQAAQRPCNALHADRTKKPHRHRLGLMHELLFAGF